MDEVKTDPRFSHIVKDPRFQRMKRKERKVTIDNRFKEMFHDSRFKLKYSVDKRGRPLHVTTNEDLKRFYDISESDLENAENNEDTDAKAETSVQKENNEKTEAEIEDTVEDENAKSTEEDEEEEESDDSCKIDLKTGPDYARGEVEMSSSEEDDEEISEPEEDNIELPWGETDRDAPKVDTITHRLAVCNMDWDRIKAQDLMVLLNSFKPRGGLIKSVAIYPSEFGAKRMKEEDMRGPTELVRTPGDANSTINNEEEYHREKLRLYQLNRLKYYYGVVECDSKETANHIYEECDGAEYEGSSNRIDLRFIPDDMTFDQQPREMVFEMPDQNSYKPLPFISSTLQQTKVNLTWDETDPKRLAVTMRKFTKDDLEALDVEDYLASDSGSEADPYAGIAEADFQQASGEEDEDTLINKYRALLQGIEDADKVKKNNMEMEITWEPGLKETTKDLVKKSKEKAELTPWEKYLEKSKNKMLEKKKKKSVGKEAEDAVDDEISNDDIPSDVDLNDPYFREELDQLKVKKRSSSKKKKNTKHLIEVEEEQQKEEAELELLMLDEKDEKKHFNLKELIKDEKELKGKKKRRMRKLKEKMALAKAKKEQEDDFEVDVDDARFKELYENPLFNIDPTAPEFKRTKATEKVIEAKLKRRMPNLKDQLDHSNSPGNKKQKRSNEDVDKSSEQKRDPGLANLIKSVKAKTKSIQEKKKKMHKL